jgi:hypothetical protein
MNLVSDRARKQVMRLKVYASQILGKLANPVP